MPTYDIKTIVKYISIVWNGEPLQQYFGYDFGGFRAARNISPLNQSIIYIYIYEKMLICRRRSV